MPTNQIIILFCLGFSSGLPLALITTTLQAWLTVENVNLAQIGLLALVGQPYVFKFLWAPLVDRYPLFAIGRRHSWILISQILIAILLLITAILSPTVDYMTMTVIALLIAFWSATQDVAYDAYRVELLSEDNRGLGTAISTTGYRVAMIISGSLALMLADIISWKATYQIMAALMGLCILATVFAPRIKQTYYPTSLQDAFLSPLKQFFQRKQLLTLIAFIIFFNVGSAFTSSSGSLTTTFLLRECQFSLTEVGFVNKGFGLTATLLGLFMGGLILKRVSLYRCLMSFGLLQAAANLLFMLLALTGKSLGLLITIIFSENICTGMAIASLLTFFMSICDKQYSATQFALLTGLSITARVFLTPLAVNVIEVLGWPLFYLWTFFFALPAFILLGQLRAQFNEPSKEESLSLSTN